MRIIYVGKHGSGGNDDEGAIHFALEKLGHDVVRVQESHTKGVAKLEGDFLLCHHWHNLAVLREVKIPKVFWCFDLIDWPDGGPRHQQRCAWMRELTEVCDLGFLTDGDWVARNDTGKLYWMTQGADERPLDPCLDQPLNCEKTTDILFVGGIGYGRDKFVQELRERYGERFKHVLKGCYGLSLAVEISRAKIVVAPDSPVTDRYWSNRVYNVLRLGGFLLHPWSEGISCQYHPYLLTYSRNELPELIDTWIEEVDARQKVAVIGSQWTMQYHTYRHRCQELLKIVQEKLL